MKNFEHPEFHIFHKLQLLQKQYPDVPELADLTEELRNIINENVISVVQYAHLYALLGKEGDLSPDTRKKLLHIFEAACAACKDA